MAQVIIMKNKKNGFTLIELLVVVLIIAVLAAIALPKYFAAVQISRIKAQLATVSTLSHAQERYFLATGQYSKDISQLDVTLPYISETPYGSTGTTYNTDWGLFRIRTNSSAVSMRLKNYPTEMLFWFFSPQSKSDPGYLQYAPYDASCVGYTDETKDICVRLGGTLLSTSGEASSYGIKL